MVREVKVSWEGGHHWDWPGARSGFSDVDEIPVWNKKKELRSRERKAGQGDRVTFLNPARGGEPSPKRSKESRRG